MEISVVTSPEFVTGGIPTKAVKAPFDGDSFSGFFEIPGATRLKIAGNA